MGYVIKTKDLAQMTIPQRDKVLGEMVRAAKAPRNGQATVIDARIQSFEQRYEITSEELLRQLSSGRRHETAEIAQWLFWLDVRNRAHGETRSKPAR